MGKELYNTPFDKAACPTPASDTSGEMAGQVGGYDWTDMPPETANMSGLKVLNTTLSVKEGPAPWSQVAVEPGVASPAVPAASIKNIG